MLVFLFLFLFFTNAALAAQPLVLEDTAERYALGGTYLDILEDQTGRLTILDVTSTHFKDAFAQSEQSVSNFGMTDSAFWFRFVVEPKHGGQDQWLLLLDQPLMDEVDLYVPRSDGSFDVKKSGDTRPISLRAVPEKNILLPLDLSAAPQTFYLRAWVPGRAIFPFTVLTKDAYGKMASLQGHIIGGFGGFLFAISWFGFLLFLLFRDRVYLIYTLYILGILFAMLMINGYVPLPKSPAHPWLHHYAKALVWSISILAGAFFTRSFLKTPQLAPYLDLLLKWFVRLYPLFLLIYPLVPPLIGKKFINGSLLATSLVAIAAAVACYRKGYPAALYFLYSRCSIYIAAILFALLNMGLLPLNFFTGNIYLIASSFDVLFISLALSANFSWMNRRMRSLVQDLKNEVGERTAAHRALEEQMAERKKLEREVARISEEERRRISQELHDGLCQQLTGARLRFSAMEDRFAAAGLMAEVKPLGRLLAEAVDHAYRLSRGLWSTDSSGKGTMIDLQHLARQFSEQSGICIEIAQSRSCSSCASENMNQVHHIAREAMFNAVKHSCATRIDVMLRCDQDRGIFLEVRDNGRGIDEKSQPRGGMGIRIIKHRSEMIGGSLHIGDADGGGTLVVCTAPCRAT